MKLADVAFPGTFEELAAMPSAELRVLVGKLDNGAALHPKIASMGYHMTKAERVQFLGFHHYGVGAAEQASSALSNAELKYAEHQAKKGAKTGAKVTGSGPSTNCTATAAKALTELASNVPPLTKFATSLDGWASQLIDPPDSATLKKWAKQLATDTLADDGETLLQGISFPELQKVDNFLTKWTKATDLSSGYGEAPTPKQLWQAAEDLKKAADDVAEIIPGTIPEAHGLAGSMTQKANSKGSASIFDAFGDLSDAGLDNGFAPQSMVNGLKSLADVDTSFITPKNAQGLLKKTDTAIEVTLDKLTPQQLADIGEGGMSKLSKVYVDLAKAVTDQPDFEPLGKLVATVQDAAKQLADEAAAKVSGETLDAAKALYSSKTKAELKKLGPPAFKDAGVDTPSLAHYLTKDELAEALAKIDAGQPIDELLDVANAKKAAHKGQATATQKATKDGAVQAPDVPAFKAAPDTADTTVLAPKDAQTKAAKAKPPETQADVEKLAVPDAGPPPDALGVPGPKYPKPAQTEHSYTYKPNQANLGGAHTKAQYLDEDQDVWMWKKADSKGVAQGEALAHDIGWDLGFDMADIRYADGWEVPGKGTFPHGTVQKFHQGVKGDMKAVPIGEMTPEQLAELQEHQVFDWLISQHDTHSENILVMADGHLAPIDKGQAFKFFGKDKLEVGYSPPGNFGKPVYYDLWDDFAAGKIDLNLDHIDAVLARIDQLDEGEFLAKVQAYVDQRFKDAGRSIDFLPAKLRSPEKLAKAILERKRQIREDFTEFYKAQAARRGETWTPIWEKRLADAAPELIEEAGEAAVTAGITTPITEKLAADVQRFGSGGKTVHLAGKDVNQSQALFWVEQSKAGKPILRMEARLEADAQKRVGDLFRSLAPDAPTAQATSGGGGYVADPLWNDILAYAKTVGAHADDGLYNAETVKKTANAMVDWAAKADAKEAAAKLALDQGDLDTWSTLKAQAEQYEHYGKAFDQLSTAQMNQVKPPFPIEQFDGAKAKQGWLAKAPNAPTTKTAEPAKDIFVGEVKVGADRTAILEPTDGFQQFRRTGGTRSVSVGRHGSVDSYFDSSASNQYANRVGKQYDAVMDIDGTKVTVHYRGFDTTAAIPRKGMVDVELEGWDGTPEAMEKLLTVLDRLGVDSRLATAEDEALSYWRQLTGSFKHSTEYVQGNGSGAYGKVRSTIDGIEQTVKAAGNLTPQQEADIYREAWTKTFGEDAVARAPERISGRPNIFGEDMGYGHIDRFDLPEDLRPSWTGHDGRAGWVHGTRHLTDDHFSTFSGAEPTETLVRKIGLDTKPGAGTSSAADDLYTGGAAGSFASPGWSGYATGNDFVLARPAAVDLRASTYAYSGDQWGSLAARDTLTSLDPAVGITKGGHGEVVARGGFDFGHDTEAVVVRSKGKRDAMLEDLRAMGVTEIRGRPIEERVLFAQTDGQAQALVKKITDERPEMFRPYDALPDTKGPPAPKKAKATRAKKAKPSPQPPAEDLTKLAANNVPDVQPFAGPPTSGTLSNGFSDLSYSDALNPFDADFPAGIDDLWKLMSNEIASNTGVDLIEVTNATQNAIQHALKVVPDGNTVDVFEAAKSFGSEYHALQAYVENQPTALKKVTGLMDIGKGSDASKQHLAELLDSKSWEQLVEKHKASGDPTDLIGWMKKEAANKDGADALKPIDTLLKIDPTDAPKPLFSAELGDKVTYGPNDAAYAHVIEGYGDVTIQITDMGSKIILSAEHQGSWYKIGDLTSAGPPSPNLVKAALQDVKWPAA